MFSKFNKLAILFPIILTFGAPALAYVGPGLGAGTVAVVLGVVIGLLMLIVGVVWYPIKRLLRHFRNKK